MAFYKQLYDEMRKIETAAKSGDMKHISYWIDTLLPTFFNAMLIAKDSNHTDIANKIAQSFRFDQDLLREEVVEYVAANDYDKFEFIMPYIEIPDEDLVSLVIGFVQEGGDTRYMEYLLQHFDIDDTFNLEFEDGLERVADVAGQFGYIVEPVGVEKYRIYKPVESRCRRRSSDDDDDVDLITQLKRSHFDDDELMDD